MVVFFFFFFKQKTAYEMRISDWSSDVCSSDLLIGIFVLLAIGMPLGFASGFLAAAVMLMRFGPDLLFSSFGTGPLNILAQRMYGLMTDYVQIGRASCRERVCQYV